jgi:Plasmid pRiA4b ORF-3-like protein
MNRHLETCKQRATLEAAQEKQPKGQTTPHLHLLVEGRYLPMYWMHLNVPASAMLKTLDQFLRDIWLECCGHLSAFEIDGVRYTVDEGLDEYVWGDRQKHMRVRLDTVLHPGKRYSYEYDFGSTTELVVKVISEHEARAEKEPIQVLARNTMPWLTCDVCEKLATSMCSECKYEGKGYLCDTCAKEHSCGEEMLLPVVNSPRAGVCGYPG